MTANNTARSGHSRRKSTHRALSTACALLALTCMPAMALTGPVQPRTSLHAGISDAPDTPNTDFILLRHVRPRDGLPLGLDFLALNLGSIGRHATAPAGSDQRVHFASLQFGYDFGRVTLASGIAAVSHVTEYLSSGYQFHSHLGIRIGRWELGFGHLSNAHTRQPNKGESYVSLGLSF